MTRSSRPPMRDWRPPRGLSLAERALEQDQAAGGRSRREVRLAKGATATASVELKCLNAERGRVYAYLRFAQGSRTLVKYIGPVYEPSRAQALQAAWRAARKKALLDQSR